jgi:hypothetical protein
MVPGRGQNASYSRLETLRRLLKSSSSTGEGRISKPQRRLRSSSRLLPEKSDFCERHNKESFDEHRIAAAESAGEYGARDTWETDTAIDQQREQAESPPSNGVKLNEAIWSALRKYV